MSIHDQIKSVLNGECDPESLGPYWRFDLALPIYKTACKLLDMPKDQRQQLTDHIPPRILDLCRAEAKRLLALRGQ